MGLKIHFQEQAAWVPLLRAGPGQGDLQELCRRDQEAGDPDEKAGGNNRTLKTAIPRHLYILRAVLRSRANSSPD